MILFVLACAEPEPSPVLVSPEPTASFDLRVDLLPGVWPNRLPEGDVAVVAYSDAEVDTTSLEEPTLSRWDRSDGIALTAPESVDLDGDGLDDARWVVSSTEIAALMDAPSGRLLVDGVAPNGRATGWDLIFVPDAVLSTLPAPTGTLQVGTLLSASASSREDPLTLSGRPRTLPVQVWFPTDGDGGVQPGATYLNKAESEVSAAWYGLASDHFDRVIGHAQVGVPVKYITPAEPWPVVLVTSGEGPAATHGALAAEIASHGFVVVVVTPPFSGVPCVLPDGSDATLPELDDVSSDDVAEVWVADVQQLLDTVTDWTEGDLRFEELLDTQRVVHLGVGFGGAVGIEACRADTRLQACIDLDGEPLDASLEGKTGQALLVVSTGTGFTDSTRRAPLLEAAVSQSWSVELSESGLGALWDMGHHVDGYSVDTGTETAAVGHALAAAYVVDFLDQVLRGGPGALLAAGDADGVRVRSYGE